MGPPDFIQGAVFLRSTYQAARMSSHDQQRLALASATTGLTTFLWSAQGVHLHSEMIFRGGGGASSLLLLVGPQKREKNVAFPRT